MLLARALRFLTAVLMAALVAVVFAQVALRYLTYQPVAWTEELARFLFIWLCLVGAAEGARSAAHFSVRLLADSLSGTPGKLLRVATKIVEASVYAVIAYGGFDLLEVVSGQHSITLKMPMSFAYAAIPSGFGLMSAFSAAFAFRELRRVSAP